MHDELQLWLIRLGIKSIGRNPILESLSTFSSFLGLATRQLLTGSTSRFAEVRRTPPLE